MNSREIQRLRKKFIMVAMLSLFLAMFCIGAAIFSSSVVSYRYMIHAALNELAENDGDPWSNNSETETEDDSRTAKTPSVFDVFTSQFDRYNHYFAVIYDVGGNVEKVKTSIDSTGEESLAETYAKMIYSSGKTYGRYGKYYYKSVVRDDGSTIVVFLDCRTEISALSRLLYSTVAICILGLLITFFLVRHLSWRLIQPEIENSSRQKQFITNASHELKTPLAVIRANTELEEMLNGEDEWTQSTINQIDRMNGLIQNLVMIARAQEQEDKSELSEVDVTAAVNESVDPFDSLARQGMKTLQRNVDPDIKMKADSSKIRQLVTILIDNAIKYCDDKGSITVGLTSIRRGKGVQITVSNSYAQGANVDYQRFFDRFYREDQSHNIDKGGYGVGLSMAESICRLYSGSIRADWKDGVISFTCELF